MKSNHKQSLAAVFERIPSSEVLQIAERVQESILTSKSTVELKEAGEQVTEADLEIQRYLLQYFAESELSGTYFVKAEEELGFEQDFLASRELLKWQLLIDPIDGTKAFAAGRDSWGTMIGICDLEGRIVFSWNLLASGVVFSSEVQGEGLEVRSWDSALSASGRLHFDVYDYDGGASGKMSAAFAVASGHRFPEDVIRVRTYPGAVIAGYEVFRANLDGLLWLPGEKGKRIYPEYDLIFLGALAAQGWQVALGKIQEQVEVVAVAPSADELDILWAAGLSMVPSEKAAVIERDLELRITNKL